MRKFLVLGFVLVCGVCFGQSSYFSYIGKTENNVKCYASLFKKDSIRGITDIWVKRINPSKTIKTKSGKFVKIKGEEVVSLERVFCNEKKILTLSYTKYDNKGNTVKSNQYSEYGESDYIIPDSIGENYYEFACKSVVRFDPDAKYE